jgi:hypothetical protein
MPIYTLPNGKKYNIPEDQTNAFLNKFPSAVIEQEVKLPPTVQGAIVGSDVAPVNMDLALGMPSSDSLGNLNKQLLDLTISYNNPEKEDITFSESVANSLNNMVERIKQISPKINLTSGMIYRKIFGDENINKFVEYAGEDSFWTEGLSEEDKIEAINKIQESQAKSKETGEIIEGFKEGDISDIAGGIFNAATSFVPSLIEGGAGFLLGGKVGAGLMIGTDFFGDSYISINEEKAKRLNIPLEELVNSGKDEVLTPLVFSSAMAAAETIGLGKVASAASKQLTGAAMRKLSNFILAGAAESGTEVIQTALEKAQQTYGKTDDVGQTAARFAEAFTEQDTWEAGVQGFIGGAGFSGLGNKDVRNAISLGRAPEDIKGIESDIDELSNLNTKLRGVLDKTAKKGIENKISEVEERLKNRIIKGNAIFDFASDKDINDINNLDDLAKLQVKRFNDLKEKKNKNKITEEEYALATEGYKAEYIKAKNRIQGVKENLQDKGNKQAQKVNKLYEDKGKEGIAEILELYRPMAKRIASKYRNVPGFEMDLMVDEILTGQRGILDLINSYKPDTKVPLSAYVNKFAATRGIEAAQRNLKTDFELDVTEAKGVTDTTAADTQMEVKEQAKQEIKTELAKDLNLSEDTQNEVVAAVEKTLGTKLPAVTDKKFKQALTTGFRNELTNTFKKVFGRTAAYEQFLRDNFEKIYPAIPQETINRNFKEFNEPVLDPKTGKQLREKTAEGKKVFKKRYISKAEFLKYFLNAPGSVKGARKTSLAKILADEIGLDNVLTSLSKPEVVEKFKAIQELQGQEVPSNFIEIISEKIDRAIDYLDKLQKNNDTLYVSLIIPELAIALAKTFLKSFKLAFKATGNFAKALKKAIDEAKKLLPNKEEQQVFEETAKKTFTKPEDIADIETNEKFVKNLDVAISEVRARKIVENKIIELQKSKNLEDVINFMRYIGDPLKNGGFVVGNNSKELFEFVKSKNLISKEDLKRFKVTGKVNFTIFFDNKKLRELVKNSNPKTMTGKSGSFAKDPVKFTQYIKENLDDFDNQAEYNKKVVLDEITRLTFKNLKEDAKNLLQLWGSNTASDTPLRMMGKLRSYQKGVKEVTYEHTPPIATLREQLEKIIDNYKEGDSALDFTNAIKKVLDKSFVDLVQSRQKGKDLIPKTGNTVDRYNNILDVNKDLVYFKNDPNKKSLNRQFNEDILQKTTKVDWAKRFSPVEAKVVGKGKGKKFFIPYSADDFVGLLYATLGKGKVGDRQMEWYKENLLRPFSRGIQQYEAAKQKALRDWQVLKKEAKKDVPGGLGKRNATGLTNQDAVRIYIWATQGMDIPGTEGSPELVQQNLEIVKADKKLKAFADRLMALQPEGYPEPSDNWDSGDITTDIVSYINGVKRSEFLTEWKQNADEIFSDQNKEKLRALYGDTYVEALNDMLHRMRTGTNRKFGASKIEKQFMDWTNNSVGAIMFFNARSAVLQTLSAVNFINFSDNNPINAALAFGNFPQYVKDFTTLFNSDFLKQRRTGLQTDVNADEIARAAKGSKNTARAMLSALLKFGFTPTQIADSFAIASGGATMYRNRINKYLKEGLSQKEAESKAFTDFQEIAEETQQSARPDRISSQQASSLGRLILAFGNTPMQYARLTKKATLDLINGRGDWKTNISKIAYYSVIQNIIFSALQQGLFALLFDDEDDDKEKSRLFRIGNSSFDTLLRGIGVYGAAAATVKNMIIEIIEQSEKSRPDYTKIAIEATSLSPPINSKLRKLESAGKTFTYKQSKEKVFTEGFSLENPAFLAGGKVLSAATNLPADRIVQKADHLYTAMQSETELWQAIALSLGWSEWDLNMIEKQTKKSKKFNPRDTNRNINRTVKRKFKR